MALESLPPWAVWCIAGAFGGFLKDLLSDGGAIVLPGLVRKREDDGSTSITAKLGVLGSILLGAGAGFAADNSPLTAFLAGFSGSIIVEKVSEKTALRPS